MIPEGSKLIYPTDSPTEENYLYGLSGDVLSKLSSINGSCIFACKFHNCMVGSTTVENQTSEYSNSKNSYKYNLGNGIKDWYVEIFKYDLSTKEYKVLLRVQKDIWPMLAFGFGYFAFPNYNSLYKGNLFCWGQSVKNYDNVMLELMV